MMQSHAPLLFPELPDRTPFRGPDDLMYLKVNGVCVRIKVTPGMHIVGWGQTFAWKSEWDALMTFTRLPEEDVERFRRENTTTLDNVGRYHPILWLITLAFVALALGGTFAALFWP